MTLRPRLFAALVALSACSVKSDLTDSAGDIMSSGTGATTDDGGTLGHSQTSNPATSDGPTSAAVTTASPSEPDPSVGTVTTDVTSGGTDFTTSIGPPTASDTETSGPPCNDVPDQPLHAACADFSGCGCASGVCFGVPALGGYCGECLDDSDCPGGGCTVPDPVHGVGSLCNDGGPGDGCGSDTVCTNPAAPHCGLVITIPGILDVATCGECETDGHCSPDAPRCTPVYDFAHFTGQFACLPDASVPNNTGCASDAVCVSGFCGEASIQGLFLVGICGECLTDADCDPGKVCSDPAVDLDIGLLIGSACI